MHGSNTSSKRQMAADVGECRAELERVSEELPSADMFLLLSMQLVSSIPPFELFSFTALIHINHMRNGASDVSSTLFTVKTDMDTFNRSELE